MLTIHNLHAYYGASHVLQGVHLQLAHGEIVSILGRNGVGRSTLAKSIMGLTRCTGSIQKQGQTQSYELLGLAPYQIAQCGVGYVPENREIFPTLSVAENLCLGIQPASKWANYRVNHLKQPPQTQYQCQWHADELYELFPALKLRQHTMAGLLSGGEQQMLALCRTLMGNPELILIDEPTEGLAPKIVASVVACLQTLQKRGLAIMLIEQKLAIALELSQRVYVMGQGKIVFAGTPDDFKADISLRQAWLEV